MSKKGTKGRRATVLADQETIEAVCLAELGKNNQSIRDQYGISLSDGQFQYRLTKAKTAAGFKKGDGFRKAWREGRSNWEQVVKGCMPILKKDYNQSILAKIEKPGPQVSPIKEV